MRYLLALLMALPFWAQSAENQTYLCLHSQGGERKIDIVYPEGGEVPCQVVYSKTSGSEVLWSANNTVGYCQEKAQGFISKQQGWGFQCELQSRNEESAQ